MKVGTSFSKCLVDLYEGTVNYDDVLVIVSGTDFDPHNDDHWENIWFGYTHGGSLSPRTWTPYIDHEDEFRELATKLHDGGVLHQPRQYGGFGPRIRYHWLEVFVADGSHDNPSVKQAFERYQMLAGLVKDPNEW